MNKIIKEDIESIISGLSEWERFRNKVVLVSGASGFLPAYMVEVLLYLNKMHAGFNVEVIALVRNMEKAQKRFSHLLQSGFLDIRQHDVCTPFHTDKKINYIIHAASQASPKYYGTDPVGTLSANVLGTINLVNLAKDHNVDSLLFFSSGEVYGEVAEKDIPTSETAYGYLDPTKVRSCYAESKRMGENVCVSWLHQYGVKAKIVRLFHTYGPGMALDDGRVFADFVANIVNSNDIVLNSDGSAKRAFCYLTDAVKAFFLVLLKGENGEAYNVGNPKEEYSILELAQTMVNIFPEKKLKVVLNDEQPNNSYLKSSISRNSPLIAKLEQLGWYPKISIQEGFARTVCYYQKS